MMQKTMEDLNRVLNSEIKSMTGVTVQQAREFYSKHKFLPISLDTHIENLINLTVDEKNDEYVDMLPTALPSGNMPEIKIRATNDGWFDTYSIGVKDETRSVGYQCLATKESLTEKLTEIITPYWEKAGINELYQSEGITLTGTPEVDNEEEEERE